MLFKELDVQGAYLIEPEPRADERGLFARMFCTKELSDRGLVTGVSQVNTGVNPHAKTLRGLHFQSAPYSETKIVRCLRGAVFDVAVDLRPGSPTYKGWTGWELTGENGAMLYVPEGCAHGYLTLVPHTELMYFTSAPYAPSAARGVRYNDPAFDISWPVEPNLVSKADQSWPSFTE